MENLIVRASKKFEVEKFMSQVKVVTKNNVKKILSSVVCSNITSCECQNEVCVLSGKLRVDILYLSQDGVIESANSEVDFIEKQKGMLALSNAYAFDKVYVSDVNFSSNEIICFVTHNTQILGILDYELPNFEGDLENVVADTYTLSTSQFLTSADDNFVVSENVDTNLNNIEILKTNAQVVIDEAVCSVDKVVIDGRVLLETVYLDGESIETAQKQLEFKQEISAENVSPTMKVSAYSNIKSAICNFEQADNKNYLSYNVEIAAKCYVFEEKNIIIAKDMFLLSSDVKIAYDCIETKSDTVVVPMSESFVSQTDITEIADFDDILGVIEPQIKLLSIDMADNKANISAEISAYALYRDSQGIDKLEINKNVNFELSLSEERVVDSAKLDCQILSYKVKAGKEIEVVFKTNCTAIASVKHINTCVKTYESLAEKDNNDGGIKVYVVRENQSLFDIAKALNVRPKIIEEQNEFDNNFEAGQKVYVYSPINLA